MPCPRSRVPLRTANHMSTRVTFQRGDGCKFREIQSTSTHLACNVTVDVAAIHICRARDDESPAKLPTMSTRVTFQRGAGRKFGEVQNTSTHLSCNVTVDVAAIHICCPEDDEATTLQVAKARSETPLGRWNVTCISSIWRENSLRTATTHRKQ